MFIIIHIGPDCKIGEKTTIHPNVSIMHACIIGKRCIIHAGTTIGADGFGYTPSFKGLLKVPQNGIVQIDDDVEIGANTTIDRARFGRTWIKSNVKIDNQVMIAHNVEIGESSILVAQCGVAGSAEIGRGGTRRKNAWFIAYAPAENPTVALAIVIENGESGGATAAPKANQILKAVFDD